MAAATAAAAAAPRAARLPSLKASLRIHGRSLGRPRRNAGLGRAAVIVAAAAAGDKPPQQHLSPAAAAATAPHAAAQAMTQTAEDEAASTTTAAREYKWEGVDVKALAVCVAIGLGMRYLVPMPAGVTQNAWQLLSIFLATVAGLVLNPLPVGAWAFCAMTVTLITGTMPFEVAFGAYTSDVIWLIVISFFFARGFVLTGLGDRVATIFVRLLGGSSLGLAYGLTGAEAILAPAMPSTTARAGGIFLPLVNSLALKNGSLPFTASRTRLGAFLTMTIFHVSASTSAMFATGAANNLLCLRLASEMGVHVANSWVTWLKFACVPALISSLIMPLVVYKLYPPKIKYTPAAPKIAEARLKQMGPMTTNEWIMLAAVALAIVLWVAGEAVGVSAVMAAMIGLSIILLTGTLKWKDCLQETAAWNILSWFSVLIGMSSELNRLGVFENLAGHIGGALSSLAMPWPFTFAALLTTYFFAHYAIASQSGHVGALFGVFLALMISTGSPPLFAALVLGYISNLFGGITHFSSGQAAVYFGSGYIELSEIFRYGAIFSLTNIAIWTVTGVFWWKFTGLY